MSQVIKLSSTKSVSTDISNTCIHIFLLSSTNNVNEINDLTLIHDNNPSRKFPLNSFIMTVQEKKRDKLKKLMHEMSSQLQTTDELGPSVVQN